MQLTRSLGCNTQRMPHISMGLRYGTTHILTCRYTLVSLHPAQAYIAFPNRTRMVTCAVPEVTLLSIHILYVVYTAFDTLFLFNSRRILAKKNCLCTFLRPPCSVVLRTILLTEWIKMQLEDSIYYLATSLTYQLKITKLVCFRVSWPPLTRIFFTESSKVASSLEHSTNGTILIYSS